MMMPTEMNLESPGMGMPEEMPLQGISPEMSPEQGMMPPEPQPTQTEGLRAALESTNLAENLDEDQLTEIGQNARQGYDVDKESRESWEKQAEGWVKLASQVQEQRTFPWQNSSNVKYPLMTTAAMQFAARAYP